MNHSRSPAIVPIPLSKLIVERPIEDDERFTRLYSQLILGKIKVGLTRIPISQITTGFYKRSGNQTVHFSEPKSENIPICERMIRGGSRHPLELYWSPLAPNGGAYVCADDEAFLAAYINLGFKIVPCRVLRPQKTQASEASLWTERRGEHVFLAHAVGPAIDGYASVAGLELPPFPDLIKLLSQASLAARNAVLSFHRDDGSGIHYHQMLYAFLKRHERLLDSINQLISLERIEHAEALARVSYEAFLNFYIDWLSPEFFGPRLQLLSAIRTAQSQGMTDATERLDVLGNFAEFLENAKDKGRISPLGSSFHDLIYPPLSLVVHQSYSHLQNEASAFDDEVPDDFQWHVEQLGRWLDVLTAAIVARIGNDVGVPDGVMKAAINESDSALPD